VLRIKEVATESFIIAFNLIFKETIVEIGAE